MKTVQIKFPDILNIIGKSHWSIKLLLVVLGILYAPVLLIVALAVYSGYKLAQKGVTPPEINPYENAQG